MSNYRTPERPYRVGLGGMSIESSTFSPLSSSIADFSVLRGEEMLARYPFLADRQDPIRPDVAWLPSLYARAIPGGPVVAEAYAAIKEELLDRVRAVLPLDGFYLDIHGAMSVHGMDDAEADLAEAIRALVGPSCLISAAMDLHGNVSARLVGAVSLMTTYRTAPHEDALVTRQRAAANLLHCLDNQLRPLRAWTRVPVILPGERTSTLVEPGRGLYARLGESDSAPGVIDASLWVGYVWADEPRSGASVVVTGTDSQVARREAATIARRYWDARRDFQFPVPAGNAEWCIARAVEFDERAIVISDSGDNPTAGGAGDSPFLLDRLLAHRLFASGERTAIVASIADAAAVARCIAGGIGREVELSLGGKLDPVHARPLAVCGEVITLFPGDPIGGDLAVVRVGGVHVILTSRRKPYHVIRDFVAVGLDPAAYHLTVVKIGYLEPELRLAARHALLALTPGAVDQDIPRLPYRRMLRPVFPLDPDMPQPDLTIQLFGG